MSSVERPGWIAAGIGALLLAGSAPWWLPPVSRRLASVADAPTTTPQPADLPGTEITEEVARLILPGLGRNPRLIYDPVAILLNAPDVEFSFAWAEHPRGEITFHNDAWGFRRRPEDDARMGEPRDPSRGPRILVLGDSHAYGLVDTEETFCSVLEQMLRARRGDESVVWNAAVAGSGPVEYLGSLRKDIALEPDLVIVVFFSGNDFMNALPWDEYRSKQRPPPADRAMRGRLAKAREHWRAPLAQGLSQALEFTSAPSEAERALRVTSETFDEIADLCARHELPLLVVLLPTKLDVDLGDDEESIAKILDVLQLPESDVAINAALAARLCSALLARGTRVLDLLEAMRAEPRPQYWRHDHHLAVVGHRVVARELLPVVQAMLTERP